MSSFFVLFVIVIMDSSSIFIFIYLIFVKWQVHGQESLLPITSGTVETQYLNFNMSQYGPDGGAFSSMLIIENRSNQEKQNDIKHFFST